MSKFYVGSGNSNLGPYACAFIFEPSLHPNSFLSKKLWNKGQTLSQGNRDKLCFQIHRVFEECQTIYSMYKKGTTCICAHTHTPMSWSLHTCTQTQAYAHRTFYTRAYAYTCTPLLTVIAPALGTERVMQMGSLKINRSSSDKKGRKSWLQR